MRIFFAGTPECAVPALRLLAQKYNLCGVLTNPEACLGRGKKKEEQAVAKEVNSLIEKGFLPTGFPIFTPCKLDDSFRKEIEILKPDLLVCFAYGKIFSEKTISLFPKGGINIHPSLLPRWRGCAPVPAAILAGDKQTGITVQKLHRKLDSGDILAQRFIELTGRESTEELLSHCANLSVSILDEVLSDFDFKLKNAVPQNEDKVSYCSILKKEDGLIDWSLSALEIDRQIRAFTPWPGSYTFKNGEKINIIKAEVYNINHKTDEACSLMQKDISSGSIIGYDKEKGILVLTGDGIIAISVLQKQAKKKLLWKDFLNGSRNFLQGSFDIHSEGR